MKRPRINTKFEFVISSSTVPDKHIVVAVGSRIK
jgi:hypothetical protein